MLGKTASGLFWMFRYLERAEATARLLDAGFRIALTRAGSSRSEWESVLTTVGQLKAFKERHGDATSSKVMEFLLTDRQNPSSIICMVKAARDNARAVRIALTREVWEATNESWMTLDKLLSGKIAEADLPDVLTTIRQQNALVRGATNGTMLRNDGYNFLRLGTFVERADNTARILDVKYYLLLPSVSQVGSALDIKQWETILRSVSALRSYTWLNGATVNPRDIAQFLILHEQMPRSLAFCYNKIADNLGYLAKNYDNRTEACEMADRIQLDYLGRSMDTIFDDGLHEFIEGFLSANDRLARQITKDYSFEVTA
ncbi:MAG: alpha-E domain-containing protein [Erythrobacter sp.]|nr:alpha-E domain-containing protein [Erythrobacter sp.]NCQ62402.1 alpha-E domain-containing protein [Alphaproteobacteria bacterium]